MYSTVLPYSSHLVALNAPPSVIRPVTTTVWSVYYYTTTAFHLPTSPEGATVCRTSLTLVYCQPLVLPPVILRSATWSSQYIRRHEEDRSILLTVQRGGRCWGKVVCRPLVLYNVAWSVHQFPIRSVHSNSCDYFPQMNTEYGDRLSRRTSRSPGTR